MTKRFSFAMFVVLVLAALAIGQGLAFYLADQAVYMPIVIKQPLPTPTLTPTPTEPPPESGSAAGLVQWNDQPIEGVTVKLCLHWSMFGGCDPPVYSGVSGSDGRYRIDNIPPGEYDVASVVPGEVEIGWITLEVNVQVNQTATVETLDVFKTDLDLFSPGNNSTTQDTTPTLTWEDYSWAASYEVYVVNNDTYETIVMFEDVWNTSYTIQTSLSPGKYYWRIYANNGNGTEIARSERWYFTVSP
jgi:hypothetical protein